jgi:hypothetical protein
MINFKNQRFFYDPYPHAIIKDVFDEKFYSQLCSDFPDDMKFERHDYDKENNLKQKKFILNENSIFFKEIINKKESLKKIYNFLCDQKFKEDIFDLLEKNSIRLQKHNTQGVLRKILNRIKNIKKFGFEFSMISTDGGFIRPHTDGADKLISFVIPIVENKSIEKIPNSGTNILKPTEDKFKYNFLNSTVPFESTEIVREIPFNGNQIFFFVKTHNSLHSVGPMKNLNGESFMRKSINFFIYK